MRDSWGEADRIGAEELDEMGTHHGGNGGDVPPEGDRPPDPELPEVPPEWGEIPDDPSELAAEAERVRAELAGEVEPVPAAPEPAEPEAGGEPSIGTPLLIMSVAVVITLVSLFAMAWSGSGTLTGDGAGGAPEVAELPPITLTDPAGRQVALTAQSPMALLLVEECNCQQLVAATAASAPPGVQVVAVGHSAPPAPTSLGPDDPAPVRLADPTGRVRSELQLAAPADAATVVLVDRDGQITHTVPAATSVAQYQGDLTDLSR